MRQSFRLAAAAALLLLGSCSAAALLNATVPDYGEAVQRDVAYASGPRHGMDIYHPAQATGPLVVFLYGGAWNSGSKDDYGFVARPLASRGAVVVVPDYRLAPAAQYPAFIDDNAAAVVWALDHAAALGADPRKVFVVGHSAGAYDAVMLATDPSFLAGAGTSRGKLAGVVGLAGPYAFLPSGDPDVVRAFGPRDTGANVASNQPMSHVDGRNPPLLLLAGDADTTVQPRNTTELIRQVAAAGGPVDGRLYPGIGHVGLITAIAPVFSDRAPVLDDMWRFIAAHRAPN